jgi:alkyldihydroxyacetonephosphate synthase
MQVFFKGNKYMYSGKYMPEFYPWVQKEVGFSFDVKREPQEDMDIDEPNVNHEFLKELEKEKCFSRRSFEKWERIMHSHGASLREVFNLRYGKFERYIDVVVYPSSTEQVEKIVQLANLHNVVIVPYGGGTNVT